jgi:hypothetical protein
VASFVLFLAGRAGAEGITGYFDLNYGSFHTDTRDATGVATDTKSDAFTQRYRLALNRNPFPTVTLNAGGTFERTATTSEGNGVEGNQLSTRLRPFVDLSLNTTLVTVGGGYYRDEARSTSNGVSSPTLIREQPSARISWRPAGFPSLDLQYSQTKNHDADRASQDTEDDLLSVNSRYSPVKDLQLSYHGSFDDFTDKLAGNEIRSRTHSGQATYSGRYWNNRATFNSMYNVSQRQTEVATSGTGDIATLLSPLGGGLSALSEIVNPPTSIHLPPNPALTDGNTALAAGVDIGVPPTPGDIRPRNLGLDFIVGTEVNTLYVWVDKQLPFDIVSSFTWEVYTSDNNQDWTLRQTIAPAPFAPFDNRFEIRFTNVISRYIKVVTKPLPLLPLPSVEDPIPENFRNIRVTELQALLRKSAASASGKTSQTSQSLNLDMRLRLLDVPSLYYEFSYFVARSSSAASVYTLVNALSANRQFSRVFSGTARVGREDHSEPLGHRVAYTYSAGLTAVPLSTLSHNLTANGRTEEFEGKRNDASSVYLNNSAELYKGINATLSGGISFANRETGEHDQGTTLVAGLNLAPHKTLNVNLSYNDSASKRTGGGQPDTTDSSIAEELTVAFHPLPTLFLFGDWAVTRKSNLPRSTTRTYHLAWSPFPGGNLRFNFGYTEIQQLSAQSRNRTISPSVQWNITPRASFNTSYQWVRNESPSEESRSSGFNSNLRVNF